MRQFFFFLFFFLFFLLAWPVWGKEATEGSKIQKPAAEFVQEKKEREEAFSLLFQRLEALVFRLNKIQAKIKTREEKIQMALKEKKKILAQEEKVEKAFTEANRLWDEVKVSSSASAKIFSSPENYLSLREKIIRLRKLLEETFWEEKKLVSQLKNYSPEKPATESGVLP